MTNAELAAQSRASQVTQTANNQQVAQAGQSAYQIPGSTTSSGQPTAPMPGQPSAQASTPEKVLAVRAAEDTKAANQQLSNQSTATGRASGEAPDVQRSPQDTSKANVNPEEALNWAVLAGQGAPGAFSTLRTAQYGMQARLSWGQGVAQNLQQWQPTSNLGTALASPVQTAASKASDIMQGIRDSALLNVVAPGGYLAVSSALDAVTNYQQAGLALGYGTPNARAAFGVGAPFLPKQAALEGAGLTAEQKYLEGYPIPGIGGLPGLGAKGAGLSSANAQALVSTLAEQGFGNAGKQNFVNGNNTTIAQGMAPLVNMGLSVADVSQWTEALRNSGTTIGNLTGALGQMNTISQTLNVSLPTLNAEMLQLAQATVAQGGTQQQAANMGDTFSRSTGLAAAPAIAAQAIGSPLYQGWMAQYGGTLPSGISALSSGTQSQGLLGMVNFFHQAFGGLGGRKTATVAGVKGVPTTTGNLSDQQTSNFLQSQGIDVSAAEVRQMVTNYGRSTAINKVSTGIGDPGSFGQSGSNLMSALDPQGTLGDLTKMNPTQLNSAWAKLTPTQQSNARKLYMGAAGPGDKNLTASGIGQSEINRLRAMPNIDQRTQALQKDLNQQMKQNFQTSQGQGQLLGTLQIDLSPAAKKLIKAPKKQSLWAKLPANAGGAAPNNALNSAMGDLLNANPGLVGFPGSNANELIPPSGDQYGGFSQATGTGLYGPANQ
jgi:hypothetical protein